MKRKEKIDKWLEDEAFMSFAQKRTTEIARYILNRTNASGVTTGMSYRL